MIHKIPTNALNSHLAILAKTGAGKSYAARGIVEGLLEESARVCIVDPTSVWWGLKSSATGKSTGYPVVIFGGLHADLPLAGNHGETIAEIVGTSNTPTIIDTSQMRVRERTQFFADFADAIMRKNRGPLHLVIDEAHNFMPQGKVPDPQAGVMLAAANNLMSGGRARGLRMMLISQRPAKVHKDSLSQVETLVALRMIAPQDRKAIEDWIKDNADMDKGREIISSLATLKTGGGWVWAPELGVLDRIDFQRIHTFDSMKAPDHNDGGKGPVLAPIDVQAMSARLRVVAEKAKANDPNELKRRIADLERQVAAKPVVTGSDNDLQAAEERGYQRGIALGIEEQKRVLAAIRFEFDGVIHKAAEFEKSLESRKAAKPPVVYTVHPQNVKRSAATERAIGQMVKAVATRANGDGRGLSVCARKVLAVLAQFPEGCTSGKLALLSGYSYSGGFRNALSELRTNGFMEGANTGVMAITSEGIAQGPFPTLPTGRELGEYWLNSSVFGKCARDVLAALIAHPPGMTGEQLAKATGYEYSGGFRNALSELRTAGVIVGKNTAVMRAHEDLIE